MTLAIERNLESSWGNVTFTYENKEKIFPCYFPTGEIFNQDSKDFIRFKCVLLVGATPVMTVARTCYWFAKSIFLLLAESFYFLDGSNVNRPKNQLSEAVQDIFRSVGYGVLLTGGALIGIAAPYTGRRYYGLFERTLNRHEDGPHRNKLYIAFCLQRVALIEDENKAYEKLNKHLEFMNKVWETFYNVVDAIGEGNFSKIQIETKKWIVLTS